MTAKKEKLKKEKNKEIIDRCYVGTNIRKLPKVPKALFNDLVKMENLKMTPSQIEAYLSAIVLGLVTDKFGLEVGADTKIKALAELNKMQLAKSQMSQEDQEAKEIDAATDILFAVKKASGGMDDK